MDSTSISSLNVSKSQPRILVELRACLTGFAGIPQETRLVYNVLAENNKFAVGGLLNPFHDLLLPRSIEKVDPALAQSPMSAADRIYRQAFLITSIDGALHGIKRRHLKLRIEKWLTKREVLPPGFMNLFRKKEAPLLGVDKKLFSDFIWTTFFQKTLSGSTRPTIMNTDFFTIRPGWVEAHFNCKRDNTATKIETGNWDFFLCQVPTPFRVDPRTQIVVRYHDAIPLFLPHTTALGGVDLKRHHHALRASVRNGAYFVCTSGPVHEDLLTLYPGLETRSTVVPDMISDVYFPDPMPSETIAGIIRLRRYKETATTTQKPISPRSKELPKYILAVSTLEPRKNYKLLLTAWNAVYQKFANPPLLILVANRGWRADEEMEDIRHMVRAGRIEHLAGVSFHELRALYSNAHAVVCPSRNEGFDLSGIEAMRCGTPVVATDITVHRWVYGDAAAYFDPYDAESCTQALFNALSASKDTGYLAELREKGLNQSQLYTPQAIAPKWDACFEDLARRKHNASASSAAAVAGNHQGAAS